MKKTFPPPHLASEFQRPTRSPRENGSTIVTAMVILAALTLIAASTFSTVSRRFRSNYQTAAWHDALTSAEGGVNYALTRLRTSLTSSTGALVNPTLISGTLQYDISTLSGNSTSTNGTVLTGIYNGVAYTRIQLPTVTIPHDGSGSSQFTAVLTLDAVPTTGITSSGTNTWYRIQSAGTVPLAGGAYVGLQKYDNFLRKLQFKRGASGNLLAAPQAVRPVEVIAKPVTIGSAALFGQSGIDLNNKNVVIDSYDSRSSLTSTNGIYDSTKTTANANVVTDDNPNSSGAIGVINLSSTGAYVYGNISTNNTPVAGNTSNVSGSITQDFYQYLPSPPDPRTVSNSWNNIPASTTSVSTGSASSPNRYKFNGTGTLSLGGGSTLSIIPPATGQGYVEIWIPGDLNISGNGGIVIPANVHATFYVDGNISISGNGILNVAEIPADVILYGNHDSTVSQNITIDGNGSFAGVIYAPTSATSVKGGGSSGDMFGAITAKTIFFNGNTTLHYDQALGDVGAVIDYRIASWYEDNTLTR